MPKSTPAIDIARLRATLDEVNGFGADLETGGFNRPGYSNADMAVRRWFARRLEAEGFAARMDGVANVFGRFGPLDGPCVMVGSHLDTVPNGGAFDGALGVCVGFECLRALRDAGVAPRTAIEVVAAAEEEGRFGGMLGSQAIAGQVTQEWIETAVDADGVRLVEAMRLQGLDPDDALSAARPAEEIQAFLELHIEQGPILEAASTPIGVAHSVSGVCNLFVRLTGVANHSGTTPMEMRADAFAGLARIGCAIPAIIRDSGAGESRITIGKVALQPNFPHTIPGLAEFSVILRDPDEAVMRALEDRLRAEIAEAARAHCLDTAVERRSWLPPVALDADLAAMLREEAHALGFAAISMASGAGHDAQTMQALCPSALVFAPSRGGVSHAPDEWTDWADIEKSASLMLRALMRLSGAA